MCNRYIYTVYWSKNKKQDIAGSNDIRKGSS